MNASPEISNCVLITTLCWLLKQSVAKNKCQGTEVG